MPNLDEKSVLEIAKAGLLERSMTYDHRKGLRAHYDEKESLREGQVLPVWTVSYLTEENPYFDQNMHFIYVGDESAEILYIITPTSYVE